MSAGACPYCGSARVLWDDMMGYRVCAECGSVLEDIMEEDHRPSSRIREQTARVTRREFGSPKPRVPELGEVRRSESMVAALSKKAASNLKSPLVSRVLEYINSEPELASRTFRSRVALAVYIASRLEGYPHAAALRRASAKAGVSLVGFSRTIKRYRGLLWSIVVRVREEIERERRSMGPS